MMGWVGSGEDFCGLGWVQKFWVGLGFEKVTHDQLWAENEQAERPLIRSPQYAPPSASSDSNSSLEVVTRVNDASQRILHP